MSPRSSKTSGKQAAGTGRGRAAAKKTSRKASPRRRKSRRRGPEIVYLVGFMGSGKSTVGRLLAIRMGSRFLDLDQEISRKAGMAISKMFSRYGEDGFRQLESALLQTVTAEVGEEESLVVATGGGIVEREENIRFMRKNGLVCYLRTSYEELLRRLGDEQPDRPLWNDKDELKRRFELRSRLYEKAAHWSMDTNQRDPSQIVLDLVAEMEKRSGRSRGSRRRQRTTA